MTPEKQLVKSLILKRIADHIDGDTIILSSEGVFPKRLVILNERGERREYRIIKTKNGKFILN